MLLTPRKFLVHLCLMATLVAINALLSEISIAQSLASNDLIKRLATVPGHKPSNLVHVNIQDYIKKGEEGPRWEKSPIPSFLSEADRSRYRVLFRIQKEGEWHLADRIIATIENNLLMGHILAQRFLHPAKYRSSYQELKTWLDKYSDHPQANQMYKLAVKRRPKRWKYPTKPAAIKREIATPSIHRPLFARKSFRKKGLSRSDRQKAYNYERRLRFYSTKGWTLAYKKLLSNKTLIKLFHPFQLKLAKIRLASGYLAAGREEWALSWAEGVTKKHETYFPEANWIAGLSSWRLGDFKKAYEHFVKVSVSKYSSPWLSSAGAFWASRASIKINRPDQYANHLIAASNHFRTFYGLLANRILGRPIVFNWGSPPLVDEALNKLSSEPGGRRALVLLQVGEDRLAEREMKRVFSMSKPELASAMLAIADRAQMPALAMRLGNMLAGMGNKIFDSTAYPAPELPFDNGKEGHQELILAIIRQESGFNPKAKSYRGARGLMQLMPGTASFVARDRRFRSSKIKVLFDPKTNLKLGQRYLNILINDRIIKGDLFRLIAAWNAGPGNLSKWVRQVPHKGDPLLFIESLPAKETRIFIERVIANFWIYRFRFNQPTASLDAISKGSWPQYIFTPSTHMELATQTLNKNTNKEIKR